ncbi:MULTISPECIES: hypothetical protein [Roseomonadaceae]|uniref:Uncharacterized protein n=1 Tax=Falsiroseomonas oleicola TaxID=2801474 RepID=A0ABS6HBT5_9PROT|nr:hypothetical protein [Roseomonas oleicola]MBU8544780.1 hypothetical protein [Roseomonas oleicola]
MPDFTQFQWVMVAAAFSVIYLLGDIAAALRKDHTRAEDARADLIMIANEMRRSLDRIEMDSAEAREDAKFRQSMRGPFEA